MPAFAHEDLRSLRREAADSGPELLLVILASATFQRFLPPVTGDHEFFEDAELDDVLEAWPEPAAPDGYVEVGRLAVSEATTLEHSLQRIRRTVEMDVRLGVAVRWLPYEVVRDNRSLCVVGPKRVGAPAGGEELARVVEVESVEKVKVKRGM